MSKTAPPDAEQRLRELIAEAHGVLKDLRAEIKDVRTLIPELRAEHNRITEKHAATLDDLLRQVISEMNDQFNARVETINGQMNEAMGHIARLLGATSVDGLIEELISEIARTVSQQLVMCLDPNTGKPSLVTVPVDAKMPDQASMIDRLRRDKTSGEIFVVTDPADAPPGSIIIDAR